MPPPSIFLDLTRTARATPLFDSCNMRTFFIRTITMFFHRLFARERYVSNRYELPLLEQTPRARSASRHHDLISGTSAATRYHPLFSFPVFSLKVPSPFFFFPPPLLPRSRSRTRSDSSLFFSLVIICPYGTFQDPPFRSLFSNFCSHCSSAFFPMAIDHLGRLIFPPVFFSSSLHSFKSKV